MSTGSMTSDWYYSRRAAATGQQAGPFTWEQLCSQAQAGQLGPDDLVWNPQLPEWLAASQIPGLITGAAQPAAQPTATPHNATHNHRLGPGIRFSADWG